MTSTANELVPPWRLRVRDRDGVIRGAAVLLSDEYALTCAHVVHESATGGGILPSDHFVQIDFIALSDAPSVHARIPDDGWFPLGRGGSRDIAILKLDNAAPPGAGPAQFSRLHRSRDLPLGAVGYPRKLDEGAIARLLADGSARVGPSNEWFQVVRAGNDGPRITRGFSGAGAYDDNGAVVGIIVVARPDSEAGEGAVAFLIPIDVVLKYSELAARLITRVEDVPTGARVWPILTADSTPDPASQLRRSLVTFGDLAGPEWRPRYGDVIRQEFRDHEPVTADGRLDLDKISQASLARPGLGATLLTALRLHHLAQSTDRLSNVVAMHCPPALLSPRQSRRLRALADELTWDEFEMHCIAVVNGSPAAVRSSQSPLRVFEYLESLLVPDDTLPRLLEAAERLAHHLPDHQARKWHRWIGEAAEELNLTPLVENLCGSLSKKPSLSKTAYVVVMVRQDEIDERLGTVAAWLEIDDEVVVPLFLDERLMSLEKLADVIIDAISKVPNLLRQQHLEQARELMVEFFLPRRLLNQRVDQISLTDMGFPSPIGTRFPVVVRSLDRFQHVNQAPWQRRSSRIQSNSRAGSEDCLRWLHAPGRLRTGELFAELANNETVVVVAMSFPPPDPCDRDHDEALAAIGAGVPVLIWVRNPELASQFEQMIREGLDESGVAGLPHLVKQLRLKGEVRDSEVGPLAKSLSLLYDDAGRAPISIARTPLFARPPRDRSAHP